jgi:hypothetical protein
MSDHLEQVERIVLAGNMAWHFGLALASTNADVGVFAELIRRARVMLRHGSHPQCRRRARLDGPRPRDRTPLGVPRPLPRLTPALIIRLVRINADGKR